MTISTERLLPCPFCGGVAHLIEHVGHEHSDTLVRLTGLPKQAAPNWTVECQSCACGLIDDDRDSVIAAWNRRPASPSIGRVVVKALEWDGTVAANPFGAYTVTQTGDDDHWSYVWHEYPYGEYTGAFATEDEAKAAAQADYERRILSALTTEPGAPEQAQWRPIETAPKDGTRVDLWQQGHRVTDAFWDEGEEWWCIDSRYSDGEPCPLAVSPEPTHWMPLPAPPNVGE